MKNLHSFTCNVFSEQTFLLDHGNGEATVFDPGFSSLEEKAEFERVCDLLQVKVVGCLLTHAHLDHVMGVTWISDKYGVYPRLHPTDETTWIQAPISANLYGIHMDELPSRGEDLGDHGSIVECGPYKLEVRCAPGHSAGHVIFVAHNESFVVGGDVLFSGSIGRTDLPGGNPDILAKSIEDQIYTLPDNFTVHPGHGPSTTVGKEKMSNPYVNGAGTGMLQK
ncbi:MAG TPA: MBL fold metallo-hydrolase [Flavobacteriales bacterium]|jgi:glyoxylase-like metal-dependent hydrolase (beta-lactamase superfamily II)|nr:MBL fold metallo-hydrolase [Flavobacteriales bacterium]HIB76870.1 MBL fold metallo-hydrolase [Flavobacteriales bacterium]HIN40827.1 MBL fold metallo-hydrolase [Flavobacteriales bacterium]HIO16488.1 MBL fold metallo-hydrolase [Flavobacteriales bacterium]